MGNSNKYKKSPSNSAIERINPEHIPFYRKNMFMEHYLRYQFALSLTKNKFVVDIACGTGFGSFLLTKSAKKIVAIDNDAKAIAHAKKTYVQKKVTYLLADAHHLPLQNNSVDIVVSFETIEHVKKPEVFLKEIRRILKKDGLIILSTPNKKTSYGDNPYHLKEFTFEELKKLMKIFYGTEFYGQRQVNRKIFTLYKYLFDKCNISFFRFFLHFRPWENTAIKKITNIENNSYLYFIAVARK